MSTQLTDKKFIKEVLAHEAWAIAYHHVQHWPHGHRSYKDGGHNDFQDYKYFGALNKPILPDWQLRKDGLYFIFNQYAEIAFKNPTLKSIDDLKVGEPKRSNEKPSNAITERFINKLSTPVTRTYAYTRSEETTSLTSHTVGVSLTTSFKAKHRWGNDGTPTGTEVEVGLEASAKYEKLMQKSSTSSKSTEQTVSFEVAPNTQVNAVVAGTTCDLTQVITAKGNLDFQMHISGHGDFHVELDGIDHLNLLIDGLVPEDSNGSLGKIAKFYRYTNPGRIKFPRNDLSSNIRETFKFQGATGGNLTFEEKKI